MKNKRGSYVILAALLFSAILILVSAVLYASGEEAISSTLDSFGKLWGRSILAEYDLKLKDRYGIFAFYADKATVEEKLDFYAEYSCGDKAYIDIKPITASIEEYCLTDSENFAKQLREAVLADTKPLPLAAKASAELSTGENSQTSEYAAKAQPGRQENRYIKNRRVIKSLPSGGKGGGVSVLSLLGRLKEGVSGEAVMSAAAENIYMFRFFKDCMNDRGLGDSFFENEIEYILTGKLDDAAAREEVESKLSTLRNGLNLEYLYKCEEKRNAALAAAELLMPETPWLAQALILEGWAYMEARNDIKLLYAGKEVPIIKRDENWALSLENLLATEYGEEFEGTDFVSASSAEEADSEDYLSPARIEGKNYEEYLKILAAALPQKSALLRMMDIIQINMKYTYCEWFRLSECYVGLKYEIVINNRTHNFEAEY